MKTTTHAAAIAAALTAGLVLSAPLAIAAPPINPTTNPTTKTPAESPVGQLAVSITAPITPMDAVGVHVTGVTSDNVSASIGEPGTDKVVSRGGAKASANHDARFVLPAPRDGWIPTLDYEVVVEANGQRLISERFTAPHGSGTLTVPRSSGAPAMVAIEKLIPGTKMVAFAGTEKPYDTVNILTRTTGTVSRNGTVTLTLSAPKGGWVRGVKYVVTASQAYRGDAYWVKTSFVFTGDTGAGGGTNQGTAGGLAKTGC